jgi:DNA-binding transcriptional ArsR family regulator
MKSGKSMQELSECDELKTFFDRRLIKALGHPVREHILAVLNERVASASEIGEELGADVSSFYHHIEELEKLECIERVKTRRRRGAKEHFFRAKQSLFFDDTAWRRLPASMMGDQTAGILQRLFDDVVDALEADTFNARDDRHASWTPGFFDAQGWDEATGVMNQALDRLCEIREEAAFRLAKSEERGLSATVAILVFETPRSDEQDMQSKERTLRLGL